MCTTSTEELLQKILLCMAISTVNSPKVPERDVNWREGYAHVQSLDKKCYICAMVYITYSLMVGIALQIGGKFVGCWSI
jgi:hypothetical protein